MGEVQVLLQSLSQMKPNRKEKCNSIYNVLVQCRFCVGTPVLCRFLCICNPQKHSKCISSSDLYLGKENQQSIILLHSTLIAYNSLLNASAKCFAVYLEIGLQHGILRWFVGFTEMLTFSFDVPTISHDQREDK